MNVHFPDGESELTRLIPQLERLARIIAPSPDQAEDLAQEALLQVWRRLRGGGEIGDLRPYLMTVLRNAARKPAPGRQNEELTERNAGATPARQLIRLACEDVKRALARLPEDQRALLAPLLAEGLSYAELARRFDLPAGTVMSRLSRARARLCRELDLPRGQAVSTLLDEMDANTTPLPGPAPGPRPGAG